MVAVGGVCGLVAAPTSALELGEVQVESTLGQPLRASIAFALNPNEQLFDFCVALRPGIPGALIPSVSRASIAVRGNRIILTGETPVKDPLLNLRVTVSCPYSPRLDRRYTLIVDPTLTAENPALVDRQDAPIPTAAAPVQAQTARPPVSVAASNPVRNDTPVEMQTEYQVRTGDSVSAIVARIPDRTVSMQSAISAIVAANPGAFIDNDANRIMAGSVLTIPEFSASAAPAEPALPAPEPVADPVTDPLVADAVEATDPVVPASVEPAPAQPIEPTAPPVESPAFEPVSEPAMVAPAVVDIAEPAATSTELNVTDAPPADEMVRGDVIVAPAANTNIPVVAPPEVNTPTVDSSTTSGAWSWLIWVAGGAIALILALFFAVPGLRGRFGSTAVNAPARSRTAQDESAEQASEADQPKPRPIVDDVDFEFDDTISSEAISLDADLDAGTGLQDGSEINVAQDFGFSNDDAGDTGVDLEITEEAAREPVEHNTDIIAPSQKIEESSILEEEVVPETDADEYDMSMIVDATKQSINDYDATAKDLQAVQVGAEDDYSINDDTLVNEADLAVLEQDYQEEFTQTQALNKEIEEAAMELAKRIDDDQLVETTDFDPGLEPTAEMPARPLDLEITAEMPASGSGEEVTAELTANLPTDIDAENDDVADDEDITAKFATAGSDLTVEMQVESGKVDTKKGES
jgi:phage tail protein X